MKGIGTIFVLIFGMMIGGSGGMEIGGHIGGNLGEAIRVNLGMLIGAILGLYLWIKNISLPPSPKL